MSGQRALVVFIAELQRHPGSRRDEHIEVELDGLEVSSATVADDATIVVDLVIESLSSSIVTDGTISAPWTGACRRCLGPAEGIAVSEVREVFEGRPTEGETYPLAGDHIDLEPMVRDAVLLSLPLAPLCSAGCQGPAPERVAVVVAAGRDEEDPASERPASGPPADPRWAALDDLSFD